MDFETLKQSSSNFDKLTKVHRGRTSILRTKRKTNPNTKTIRFWKPELDKTGNGFAVIRFLPAPEGEDLPWFKEYGHMHSKMLVVGILKTH